MKIYFAAGSSCPDERVRANRLAESLAEMGHHTLSRWHRQVGEPIAVGSLLVDPRAGALARSVLERDLADLDASDVVVALTNARTAFTALVEIGIAFEAKKRVLWVHEGVTELVMRHPLVTLLPTEKAVLDWFESVEADTMRELRAVLAICGLDAAE